jgi:hypothetical protein
VSQAPTDLILGDREDNVRLHTNTEGALSSASRGIMARLLPPFRDFSECLLGRHLVCAVRPPYGLCAGGGSTGVINADAVTGQGPVIPTIGEGDCVAGSAGTRQAVVVRRVSPARRSARSHSSGLPMLVPTTAWRGVPWTKRGSAAVKFHPPSGGVDWL